MFFRTEDLIGPDGVTQGYPNNVSRAAKKAMEDKIHERFGEAELQRTIKACGDRPDWNSPPKRGDTSMYGTDYRDPPAESGSFWNERDVLEDAP